MKTIEEIKKFLKYNIECEYGTGCGRCDDFADTLKTIEEIASPRKPHIMRPLPSDDEIDQWYVDRVNLGKNSEGFYRWSDSLDYSTHGDQFDMLKEFAEWIESRK